MLHALSQIASPRQGEVGKKKHIQERYELGERRRKNLYTHNADILRMYSVDTADDKVEKYCLFM